MNKQVKLNKDDNLMLWNSVCETDPSHTKKLVLGRTITVIDPYRQIEAATRVFGPVGQGWGWSTPEVQHLPTNEVAVLIRLWHSGDNTKYFEQWGQASLYTDNAQKKKDKDCMKKAETDGITKCLSCLGFNADIFLGKFDDNKYVQDMKRKFEDGAPPAATKTEIKAKVHAFVADVNKVTEKDGMDYLRGLWNDHQEFLDVVCSEYGDLWLSIQESKKSALSRIGTKTGNERR